jgi:NTP pyrophosphatase (non-canonical NTP hydrolase)
MNDFDAYQDFTRETAIFPDDAGIVYCALKLNGEAGEVAEKVGKFARDKARGLTNKAYLTHPDYDDFVDTVILELGDILWYVAQEADQLGIPLSTVISRNKEKLLSRRTRNVISGSGDTR